MQTHFNSELIIKFKNPCQIIRVLSEKWVQSEVYCPNCGQSAIKKYANNQPVSDFFCPECRENYELKSKKTAFGSKIVDGAYSAMMGQLTTGHNPNLFLLNYNFATLQVINLLVVPKHFFIPNIIEQRHPLSSTARRAGWTGCNILLKGIPQSGRIYLIKNQVVEPKEVVLMDWKKTLFLRDEQHLSARGWLLDVMACIDKLSQIEFSLPDIYQFESELSIKHPDNRHIKDKIRQQLQKLRDKGYLEFVMRGHYRVGGLV
jgi:type II restriction enzyme